MEGGNEKRRRAACRWSVTQSFWDLLFPLLPAQHTRALLFLILTLWASLESSPSNRRAESLKIHSQQPNALSKIVAPEMSDEERRIENENMRNPKLTISQLLYIWILNIYWVITIGQTLKVFTKVSENGQSLCPMEFTFELERQKINQRNVILQQWSVLIRRSSRCHQRELWKNLI